MKTAALLLGLLIAISGCAVGPLVSHETARTVGTRNSELLGGYGVAGYVAKWNFGLTDDLDVGLHWESLSVGVRAKYAFLNQSAGLSVAGAVGTGVSIGGSHYYGDLIASYLVGHLEPYGTFRYVHVRSDPIELKNTETGEVGFTFPSTNYQYGQIMLGTRYWITPNWILSLEVSNLVAFTSGLRFGNSLLVGGGLGYRF
jgi:hypothetical protein